MLSSADSHTNCGVFTPESESNVVNRYGVDNIRLNRHVQLGLITTVSNPVVIKDLAWWRYAIRWSDFAADAV